jgi:hypothetical protein
MTNRLSQLQRLRLHIISDEELQAGKLARKSLAALCLAIFFVSVGVRLLQWQDNRLIVGKIMSRLTEGYKEEAQFLLNRDVSSFVRGASPQPDTAILMHTPGYPILIALIYKLTGDSDTALRLFQILCDAAAAVLVFLIAAKLLPVGAAIAAGLLVAFSPQLGFHSLLLLPDSTSGTLPSNLNGSVSLSAAVARFLIRITDSAGNLSHRACKPAPENRYHYGRRRNGRHLLLAQSQCARPTSLPLLLNPDLVWARAQVALFVCSVGNIPYRYRAHYDSQCHRFQKLHTLIAWNGMELNRGHRRL